MGMQVNEDILNDTQDGKPILIDGVYDDEVWDGWKLAKTLNEHAPDRAELFRVNGRVYTAPSRLDGRVMFRFMRATRKAGEQGDARAYADLMYDVLGDAVMDALADEEMSDEETAAVMKVVEKHTAGVMKKTLGK
jgi:hypothetical protein